MEKFGGNERFENPIYEKMGRLFNMKQNPDKSRISILEEIELSHFLENASSKEVEEVKRWSERIEKYFIYTDKKIGQEGINKIEEEMNKDSVLKKYIESNWAGVLIEDYYVWKSFIEGYDKFKQDKERPYEERRKELEKRGYKITKGIEGALRETAEETLNRISLNKREVQKLFEFLDKYPTEIEESLSSMFGEVELKNKNENEKEHKISEVYEEISFLRDMEKYLNNQMNTTEENYFHNLIIDNKTNGDIFKQVKNLIDK